MLNILSHRVADEEARRIAGLAEAKAQAAVDALGGTSAVMPLTPTPAACLAWDAALATYVGKAAIASPAANNVTPVAAQTLVDAADPSTGDRTTYIHGIPARRLHSTDIGPNYGGVDLLRTTVNRLAGESFYIAVIVDAQWAKNKVGNIKIVEPAMPVMKFWYDISDGVVTRDTNQDYNSENWLQPDAKDGYTNIVALEDDQAICYMKLTASRNLTEQPLCIRFSGKYPNDKNIVAGQLLYAGDIPFDHTTDAIAVADTPMQQVVTLDADAVHQALTLDGVTASLALPAAPAGGQIAEHVLELTCVHGGALEIPANLIHRRYGDASPYTTNREIAVLRRSDGKVVLSAPVVGS